MKNLSKKIISGMLIVNMICMFNIPVFAYTKEETVYSKINLDGNFYDTTVSEHIKNDENAETLRDISNLLGITNSNGDEIFTQNGEKLEWKANGNDIYYQGNINKELPLDCKITYKLDGNEINGKDLAGKSGKITIKVEYKNKEKHSVTVNGKTCTMYTPFVIFTGTILNKDVAKNVKITNGKVIDNGEKIVVLGISCPGMKESLGLENKDIEIPEFNEIEFEAKDFEMNNIMSYATPKILEDSDLSKFDELEKIYKNVKTLSDSSKQIVNGANELYTGTKALSSGSKQLRDGINSAYEGAKLIEDSVDNAVSSMSTESSIDVSAIAEQAKSNAQTSTPSTADLQKIQEIITENMTGLLTTAANSGSVFTAEQQALIQNYMANSISQASSYTKVKTAESTATGVATEIAKGVNKTTKEMKTKMTTLQGGLKELSNGLYKLKGGSNDLVAGTSSLENGAETLKDGIVKFDSEGIKKIADLVNGNVKDIQERLKKLKKLADEYKTYAGAEKTVDSNVKFIFKTDSIKK